MGGASRFALATAQAVFDRVGNGTNIALLHDQRPMAYQPKTGRVGLSQVGPPDLSIVRLGPQQLPFVEATFGIDRGLAIGKRLQLSVGQKLQLGDANAVLAGNHIIQAARHGLVSDLQHFVVVAVERQVGVHIAVVSVPVQRRPNPTLGYALMNRLALGQQGRKRRATESLLQWRAYLCLPGGAQRVVLWLRKKRDRLRSQDDQSVRTSRAQCQHLLQPIAQQLGARDVGCVVGLAQRQVATGEEMFQRLALADFVGQGKRNDDALNALGALVHSR